MSPHTVFDLSPSSLEHALVILTAGGIVVCPSDTVYGLLVDATNESAVKKLIHFKERPVGKAISVFVSDMQMLEMIVEVRALPESARSLLPGPYTLVLSSRATVSSLLESEKGTLGVRLIGHKSAISNMQSTNNVNANSQIQGSQLSMADKSAESADQVSSNDQDPKSNAQTSTVILSEEERSRKISNELNTQSIDIIPTNVGISPADFVTTLVSMFGKPVTATSANLAGKSSCYSIQALLHQLPPGKLAQIDLVIDAGELPHHPPSTVLDLTTPTPTVLRGTGVEQAVVTHSPEETMDVAEKFIARLLSAHRSQLSTINSKFVIYFHGDLGAGKTHFVKGIARYFGFDRVVSPTYVGMHEYVNERVKLYHIDLYNFESKEDIDSLGIDAILRMNGRVTSSKFQVPSNGQERNSNTQTSTVIMPAHQRGESPSSQLAASTDPVIPTIICIEWPESGALTYPGTHVYMEYGGENERVIRIA